MKPFAALIGVIAAFAVLASSAYADVAQSTLQYNFNGSYASTGNNTFLLAASGSGNSWETTTKILGNASIGMSGSGSALALNPTGLATGNVNYTIAYWWYRTAALADNSFTTQVLIGDFDIANAAMTVSYNNPSGATPEQFQVGGSSGNVTYNYSAPTSTWVHTTVVYFQNKSLEIYINGTRAWVGTQSANLSIAYGAGGGIAVGSTEGGANRVKATTYFDDVRIYERSLNSSDIAEIYNSGNGTECNPTITGSCGGSGGGGGGGGPVNDGSLVPQPLLHYKFNSDYNTTGRNSTFTLVPLDSNSILNSTLAKLGSASYEAYTNTTKANATFNSASPVNFTTGNHNASMAAWFRPGSIPAANTFQTIAWIGDNDISGANWNLLYYRDAGGSSAYVKCSNIGSPESLRYYVNFTPNEWVHLACIYYTNRSTELYINGTMVKAGNQSGDMAMSYGSGAGFAVCGRETLVDACNPNTYVDDVRYDEVSYSAAQIAAIYNAGVGTENDTIWNATAPVISALSVTATGTAAQINFTTNIAANATINYGNTTTLGSLLTNTGFLFLHSENITGLSDGVAYYFNITACDTTGNCSTNGTNTYTTPDTTPPTVTVTSPAAQSYASKNVSVNFSATDTASNISTYWFYNGTANVTYTAATTVLAPEGYNAFVFYANDTAGNTGSTSVTFIVDTVKPVISFQTAPNAAIGGLVSSVDLTVTDANATNCYFNVTRTSTNVTEVGNTVFGCANTTVEFTVFAFTQFNISVFATDDAGNTGNNSLLVVVTPTDAQARAGSGGGGGGSVNVQSFKGVDVLDPKKQYYSDDFCPAGGLSEPIVVTLANPMPVAGRYSFVVTGLSCDPVGDLELDAFASGKVTLMNCACPEAGEYSEGALAIKDSRADQGIVKTLPIKLHGSGAASFLQDKGAVLGVGVASAVVVAGVLLWVLI